MCGRYILVTKVTEIEKRFNVQASPDVHKFFIPDVNIGPGGQGLVITDDRPSELQMMTFGFTPFWSKKRMYIFNARSEGDKNKENDPRYSGAKEIFKKPMFRHAIRSKRCLIIADGFLEGPEKEKLSKPYVVYLKNKVRPFAFAGLWDEWVNKETGEVIKGFAIITTVSNSVTQAIKHHRSPVIITPGVESQWLDSGLELAEVLSFLSPFPGDQMNAYPVDPEIKHPRAKGIHLIDPIGERIFPEHDYEFHQEMKLIGMGMTTGRRSRLEGEEKDDKSVS
ncbi:MAG: SOS response-associated peptidase [Flavobacteriales bacterium]|nr:SOS response-associated peptidase [Flavobacteriales bacterium]